MKMTLTIAIATVHLLIGHGKVEARQLASEIHPSLVLDLGNHCKAPKGKGTGKAKKGTKGKKPPKAKGRRKGKTRCVRLIRKNGRIIRVIPCPKRR
jgi:hypothetical protein